MEHIENLKPGDLVTPLNGPMKPEPDPYGIKSVVNLVEDRSLVGQLMEILRIYPPFVMVRTAKPVQEKPDNSPRQFGGYLMFGDTRSLRSEYVIDTRLVRLMRVPGPTGEPPEQRGGAPTQWISPSKEQRRAWRREQKRLRSSR